MAAGTTVGKVGTEFEQLVGKLFQLDGDPSECLLQRVWFSAKKLSALSLITTYSKTILTKLSKL